MNVSRKNSAIAGVNICADLSKGDDIKKAAEAIKKLEEPLEFLVHNAGVASIQKFGEIEDSEIERVMATNVKPQLLLTSYLMDRIGQDRTDIMCVSSDLGVTGRADWSVYSSSKWAVRGIAQSLQDEFKDKPNRVISLVPGGMASKNVENYNGQKLSDPENWMKVEDMAAFMKKIFDLPKNVQVTEIVVQRKTPM